jgi:hypothetical protein
VRAAHQLAPRSFSLVPQIGFLHRPAQCPPDQPHGEHHEHDQHDQAHRAIIYRDGKSGGNGRGDWI